MSHSAPRFARIASRRPIRSARHRPLMIDALEDRTVPANNLSVVGDILLETNINVSPVTAGTITISTTDADAAVSLETLQNALTNPQATRIVVTSAVAGGGTDADQAGEITWDASLEGSLDFTGFGTGKTLTFRTVAGPSATGAIALTAVAFLNAGTADQINLEFDSSAANGDVSFQDDGFTTVVYSAEAVNNLTVTAGTGAFNFLDTGFNIGGADAAGAVSISAGAILIAHQGDMSAGTAMTITGDNFNLSDGAGLFAKGNVAITAAATAAFGNNANVTADGNATITSGDIDAQSSFFAPTGDLTLSASTSINLFGAQLTPGGSLSAAGGTVSGFLADFSAGGAMLVTGTTSVDLSATTISGVNSVSLNGGAMNQFGNTISSLGDVTIGGTAVDLTFTTVSADTDGDISVSGSSVNLDSADLVAGGNLSVAGPATVGNSIGLRAPNGSVLFTGTVDGVADLAIEAKSTVTFQQDVGVTQPLSSVDFVSGLIVLGANDFAAATITVGGLSSQTEATLSGGGTITGNVFVNPSGNLAPGGLGTAGTTTVVGNVSFDGGDFAVDFGGAGTTDQLRVRDNPLSLPLEGNLVIQDAARLGGGLGTGQLTAASAIIIDYDGSRFGEFVNAPVGAGVLVGTDAITVTSYSPDVVVAPMPASPNGIIVGADPNDGSGFRATLTGGGQLVFGKDWTNNLFLVVRNATPASKLAVTTTPNGADPAITFGAGVLINGPLAAFTGAKANIGTQFRATGAVKAVTMRDLLNLDPVNTRIEFGGTVLDKTTITARNLFGSVITGSTLTTVKVAQSLGAQVFDPSLPDSVLAAPGVGTVTAKQATIQIESPGTVKTVRVTGGFFGGVEAGSLGTLTAGSFDGAIDVNGTATLVKTTGTFFGDVEAATINKFDAGGGAVNLLATGAIGAIVGRGEGIALDVTADSVRSVTVAGTLTGNGLAWNVTKGVGSLTAGLIANLNFQAGYLGVVNVKGNAALGIAGDVVFSNFSLSGNDGTLGAFGIKSLTAKGRVDTTRFDVRAGNVGPVSVGRFHFSQLYLNYTPDVVLPIDQGGTFGPGSFRLASFKTTAVPTADPTNPFHWAFKGSEIAAQTIGTVTLSGLSTDNGGTGFGVKQANAGSVVKVLAADAGFPPNQLSVALTPDSTAPYDPIGGDFFFIDV